MKHNITLRKEEGTTQSTLWCKKNMEDAMETESPVWLADDSMVTNLNDVSDTDLIDSYNKHMGFVRGAVWLVEYSFTPDSTNYDMGAQDVLIAAKERIEMINSIVAEMGERLGKQAGGAE